MNVVDSSGWSVSQERRAARRERHRALRIGVERRKGDGVRSVHRDENSPVQPYVRPHIRKKGHA
jgi:hypothetical protein